MNRRSTSPLSPKRRRLSPSTIANPSDSTASDDDSSDSSSSVSSVEQNAVANAREEPPPIVQNRLDPSEGYPLHQIEESAILFAIDDIGLQNIVQDIAAAPSPAAVPSSSDDDASSIDDDDASDRPSTPPEPTSDYSSSSDDDDGVDAGAASAHFDFMEAAVAVAIQKKGLLPHSIEMSPNR